MLVLGDLVDLYIVVQLCDVVFMYYGRFDVFVVNVGFVDCKCIGEFDDMDWLCLFDVFLGGFFCLIMVCCELLQVSGQGWVVVVSFFVVYVFCLGELGFFVLVVVKVGIEVLVKLLVVQVVLVGVMVNVVVFGYVQKSDLVKLVIDLVVWWVVLVCILLQCLGQLQEIVNVIVFFFSLVVFYVIGQVWYVDGGFIL